MTPATAMLAVVIVFSLGAYFGIAALHQLERKGKL